MRQQEFGYRAIFLLLSFFAGGIVSRAQSQTQLNLMPLPAHLSAQAGVLKLDGSFHVSFSGYREARLDRAGQRLMVQLHRRTGIVFRPQASSAPNAGPALLITTDHESKPVQELGEDESYTLDVKPDGAALHAANPLGALRGMQTFLQLVSISPQGFVAPAVSIQDQPRFAWRGLMIDVSRHFIPMEVLKRNLDGMEAVKMNVFHWHLSENQGFRAESRKFPKLHELGSDGEYYTQEEMRELIAYARDRGIRVVPEFDMPGHSTAWFVGHPEIASGSGPYSIERKWGVFDPAMDPSNEKTYKFLNDLIGEMAKLFPDQFFHIGGDEVNGKEWDRNEKIQAFKKSHNLKSNQELQAYFSGRVQELVLKHGKTPVGWDEIFFPGVPKTIVIQSWRGTDSLAEAAKQGYRGLLSNGYYLDLGWSAARHYAFDPLGGNAANLTSEQKQLVLGGESCIWSEYVNPENIDSRVWPRNAAIAERLWSPESTTDVESMYARMEAESQRLEWLGLTHITYQRKMLHRIAGANATSEEFAALALLAKTLEPVKDYARGDLAATEPESSTPLHRVVDAVLPESETSREFSVDVDRFLSGACKDSASAQKLKTELTQWAEADAKLQPLNQKSFLVNDAAPASAAVSQVAALGLAALDRIAHSTSLADDQKKQQLDSLNALEAQAHKALLTIPILPAVQKLVQASAGGGACALRN